MLTRKEGNEEGLRSRRCSHPESKAWHLCQGSEGQDNQRKARALCLLHGKGDTELGNLTLQPAQHRHTRLPVEDQKSLVESSEREEVTLSHSIWRPCSMPSVDEASSMNLTASTGTAPTLPSDAAVTHPLEHSSDHNAGPKGGPQVMSQHMPHVTHETSSVLCTGSEARQAKNVHPEPGWTREHAKAYSRAQA